MYTDTFIQLMVHTILLYFFFTLHWKVILHDQLYFSYYQGLLLLWHLITVSTHVHLLFILANSCSLIECFTLVFCCSFFCKISNASHWRKGNSACNFLSFIYMVKLLLVLNEVCMMPISILFLFIKKFFLQALCVLILGKFKINYFEIYIQAPTSNKGGLILTWSFVKFEKIIVLYLKP